MDEDIKPGPAVEPEQEVDPRTLDEDAEPVGQTEPGWDKGVILRSEVEPGSVELGRNRRAWLSSYNQDNQVLNIDKMVESKQRGLNDIQEPKLDGKTWSRR